MFLMYVMTMPFEKVHILLLSMMKILGQDIAIFMNIFVAVMVAFYLSMFLLYPRSGTSQIGVMVEFNSPATAAQSLIELALVGANAAIDLGAVVDPVTISPMASVNLVIFVALYLIYTLIALILLLNLLIAMLSSTFETVQDSSTLSYRIAFARLILKYEIAARFFYKEQKLFAGDSTPQGDNVYEFRSVEANSEGITNIEGLEGGDPFVEDDVDDLRERADRRRGHRVDDRAAGRPDRAGRREDPHIGWAARRRRRKCHHDMIMTRGGDGWAEGAGRVARAAGAGVCRRRVQVRLRACVCVCVSVFTGVLHLVYVYCHSTSGACLEAEIYRPRPSCVDSTFVGLGMRAMCCGMRAASPIIDADAGREQRRRGAAVRVFHVRVRRA